MACDADARGVNVNPSSSSAAAVNGVGGSDASVGLFIVASGAAVKQPAAQVQQAPSKVGMNAEETALILASLSKGKFGPVAFSSEDSDLDDNKHSDMEDLSGDDDEDEDEDGEHGANGRVQRVQQINFDGPVGSKLDFMDDAGFSHRFRNESNRVKSLVTKHISIDELRAHFDRPIIDVAKDFGICITLMKKICRRNGIKRWPHRQIRSLSKSIASMEAAMLSAHGGERDKYRDQILNLKMKRESVIADPNKENAMRPKTPTKDGSASSSSSSSRAMHPHQHHQGPKLSPRTSQPMQHVGVNGQFVASQGSGFAPVAIKTEAGSQSITGTGTGSASSHSKGGRWTSEEHAAFLEGIRLYGKDWRRVAQVVMTRSAVQTRTHAQKYLLKFAGRFPFDADGVLKDKQHADEHVDHNQPQLQYQRQQQQDDGNNSGAMEDMEMASPDSTDSASYQQSHSLMTPMSSDDTASRTSWSSEETPVKLQHQHPARAVEAMAMILNSPDSVSSSPHQSQTPGTGNARDDVPMYSPMGSSSSLGRALPSLAMPAIKSEGQPSPQKQFPSSPEQQLKSASASPSQAEAAP